MEQAAGNGDALRLTFTQAASLLAARRVEPLRQVKDEFRRRQLQRFPQLRFIGLGVTSCRV